MQYIYREYPIQSAKHPSPLLYYPSNESTIDELPPPKSYRLFYFVMIARLRKI